MQIGIKKGQVSLENGHIIKVMMNDDVHFQPNDLKEINLARLQFNSTRHCAILLVSGQGCTISEEALKLMCDPEHTKDYAAKAIVVNSLAQKFLKNFFERQNKTRYPVMAFSSKAKALKWLEEVMA